MSALEEKLEAIIRNATPSDPSPAQLRFSFDFSVARNCQKQGRTTRKLIWQFSVDEQKLGCLIESYGTLSHHLAYNCTKWKTVRIGISIMHRFGKCAEFVR